MTRPRSTNERANVHWRAGAWWVIPNARATHIHCQHLCCKPPHFLKFKHKLFCIRLSPAKTAQHWCCQMASKRSFLECFL